MVVFATLTLVDSAAVEAAVAVSAFPWRAPTNVPAVMLFPLPKLTFDTVALRV